MPLKEDGPLLYMYLGSYSNSLSLSLSLSPPSPPPPPPTDTESPLPSLASSPSRPTGGRSTTSSHRQGRGSRGRSRRSEPVVSSTTSITTTSITTPSASPTATSRARRSTTASSSTTRRRRTLPPGPVSYICMYMCTCACWAPHFWGRFVHFIWDFPRMKIQAGCLMIFMNIRPLNRSHFIVLI